MIDLGMTKKQSFLQKPSVAKDPRKKMQKKEL